MLEPLIPNKIEERTGRVCNSITRDEIGLGFDNSLDTESSSSCHAATTSKKSYLLVLALS